MIKHYHCSVLLHFNKRYTLVVVCCQDRCYLFDLILLGVSFHCQHQYQLILNLSSESDQQSNRYIDLPAADGGLFTA